MKPPSSVIFKRAAVHLNILVVTAALFLIGCVLPPASVDQTTDSRTLENAVNAYMNGRYPEAESLFTSLLATTADERLQHAARHGLACTGIMLARTPEALQAALSFRDEWQAGYNGPPQNADPRLYGPILAKLTALIRNPEPPREPVASEPQTISPAAPASPAPPEVPVAEPKAPPSQDAPEIVADLQKRLRTQEDENRRLRRQMRKLEKALQAIKEQMAAIEEIHQEIYQKKKEMQLP